MKRPGEIKVSVFATLGRRGQLSIAPRVPLDVPAIHTDFTEASQGCLIIAGKRTYEEVLPIIGDELSGTGRILLGWTPRQGRPADLMRDMRRADISKILIIGGAYTFGAFHSWVNDRILLTYTDYDNHPDRDAEQSWFPLNLYRQEIPKKVRDKSMQRTVN